MPEDLAVFDHVRRMLLEHLWAFMILIQGGRGIWGIARE